MGNRKRRIARLATAIAAGVILGSVIVTHNALVSHNRNAPDPALARELARAEKAEWEAVSIQADDGVNLAAWVFTPPDAVGAGVILLHGIGDTRAGMLSRARFLLRAGYTVLAPDSRGHGASGGRYVTYGIAESRDVRAWTDWLFANYWVDRLYGLGASMGGSVLIQSLQTEPRFRAIVAESPFSTFEEIAYDRLHQASGLPRALLWPVVKTGFAYARLRYGVDLRRASPAAVARAIAVPILLVHGERDRNIDIRHSLALLEANPRTTRLWEVPGGGHVDALSTAPADYMRQVVEWFRDH